MSRNRNDQDYTAIAVVCTEWWRALQSLDSAGKPILLGNGSPKAPDRAALAELRRIGVIELSGVPAIDIGQALASSAFLKLLSDLDGTLSGKSRVKRWLHESSPCLEPFAIAAAALAHIRSDTGGKKRGETARLLGAPRSEGGPTEDRVFAEPRFKRLIRTRNDWPGLLAQARRVAAILENKAPIGDLGASLILWNADPGIVRDWAFQYYQRNFEPAAKDYETASAGAA